MLTEWLKCHRSASAGAWGPTEVTDGIYCHARAYQHVLISSTVITVARLSHSYLMLLFYQHIITEHRHNNGLHSTQANGGFNLWLRDISLPAVSSLSAASLSNTTLLWLHLCCSGSSLSLLTTSSVNCDRLKSRVPWMQPPGSTRLFGDGCFV